MRSLPVFLKLAGRPVILLGKGEAAEAKRRLLLRAGADIRSDEGTEAALAIVAIADDDEARAAVARLKARGVLVNAPDRPDLCDFTFPAIIDRDPVLIAIGTGGASAGLAKALRQRIEALLPASLGALAAALGAARENMRARWPDAAARRRAIDAALEQGGPLDPLGGAGEAAVERWLDDTFGVPEGERLEVIALTSDDPDDLTLRAARLLGQADALFHTPEIPTTILDRARADVVRYCRETEPDWAGPGLALWIVKG